jgi:phosphatidylglycerophosphate synthase
MGSGSDGILSIPIRFVHEKLGLAPNQISTIGFAVGIIAAYLVASGFILAGLIFLAVSQIIDGLDGGVARRYHLQSSTGQILEVVYDRLNELMMFLALAYINQITYLIAVLAFGAILLVTIIEPISGFDPGFKRFMIYFGYAASVFFDLPGFQIAIHVIFWANLAGFIVGTVLADYRFQRDIDTQAIIRRQREIALGIPQLQDDPPTLLSKIFS